MLQGNNALVLRFVILAIAIIIGASISFFHELENEKELLIQKEISAVKASSKSVYNRLSPSFANLKLLANFPLLNETIISKDKKKWDLLAKSLIPFYQNWAVYDQIRIIDLEGMEKLRINNSPTAPRVVSASELQNKSSRYYFKESIKLSQGEIYVSPLDLNVEHGEIDNPYKPMIRIGTPIFDSNGNKFGVLILNYLGEDLLNLFQRGHSDGIGLDQDHLSDVQLLNSVGYWLHADDQRRTWGFMIKERSHHVFSRSYPNEWDLMQSKKEGVIESDNGIFIYKFISPIGVLDQQETLASDHWIVFSHVSNKHLNELMNNSFYETIAVTLFLLLLIGVGFRHVKKVSMLTEELNVKHLREAMQEHALDCIITCDEHFNIIDANKSASLLLKLKKEKLIGQNLNQFIVDSVAVSKNEEIELELIQADNVRIHIEGVCSDVNYPNLKGTICFFRDITARKRDASLARASAEIIEMIASDIDSNEVYDVICRLYEERHPMLKTSILRLCGGQLFHCSSPSLPEEYASAIDGVVIGSSVGSCGTAAFREERVIVEDISTDPLWDNFKGLALSHNLQSCWSEPIINPQGKVLGTFAMYSDHLRKPNEDELDEISNAAKLVCLVMERDSRGAMLRKLSQAIEQAGESVIITDKEGIIEYVNPAFTELTGYTPDEAIGSSPRLLKSGNQSDKYYEKLWTTIASGEVWHESIIDRRRDGSTYPALMTISSIKDKDGNISHYVGIQQDMTSYNKLEERFLQAQKMEALGTLVGGIAHDFNNMLAGMTGNLYMAKKGAKNLPEVVDKLEIVEKLSFQSSEMIKQMLLFARKSSIEMTPFSLTSFVKEITKICESLIPENIKLSVRFCNDDLTVKGDATQFQQVVMNLVNNARDALEGTQNPEITLRLDLFEADEVFLTKYPDMSGHQFAHLTVSDNGTGISDEDKLHIFEPFYTTKDAGKGTGLGLAMCYGAIQSHAGIIEVSSTIGKGSGFHIYLPLAEEEERNIPSGGELEIPLGNEELILLVDDNETVLNTGRELIESLGYRVLTASDGVEAINVFAANSSEVSLVIMDVVMPKKGGVEASEKIKAFSPEMKIIFSSGYAKDEKLNSELSDFIKLDKPYDINTLARTIRKYVRH